MKWIASLVLLVTLQVSAQQAEAYQLYTSAGKRSGYNKLVAAAEKADIVLFGELHDDPIAHWMQYLLTKDLFEADSNCLLIGAEMFERHQQQALNNYLSGKWELKTLKDSAKLWSNFGTDYLPVVNFAKDHQVPFIATNVYRPIASRIFKKGMAALDSLTEQEKQWVCPVPFEVDTTLSQYRELIKMGKEMHASGLDFAYAQAVKDATMAYSILQYWKPGRRFIHFNGAYHSDFHQSIEWYLKKANPELKIVTISTVTQESVWKLEPEYKGKADFIIVVPSSMTRTME